MHPLGTTYYMIKTYSLNWKVLEDVKIDHQNHLGFGGKKLSEKKWSLLRKVVNSQDTQVDCKKSFSLWRNINQNEAVKLKKK